MDAANQFETGAHTLRSVLADYHTVTLVANNPLIRLNSLPLTEGRQIFVFLNTAEPLQSAGSFSQDCMILSGMSHKEIFALKNGRVIGLDHIAPGCCKAVAVICSRPYGGRPALKNWAGSWIELSATGPWPYPPVRHPSTGSPGPEPSALGQAAQLQAQADRVYRAELDPEKAEQRS